MMPDRIQLPATLEHVSKFVTKLDAQLRSLPMSTRVNIVLAVQELLVNIVKHAYAGEPGTIDFTLKHTQERIEFIIEDHATNTFEMPDVIAEPDPLALPEGGMGIFIIHQAFDEVSYSRLDKGNRWKLYKHLGA